MGVDRHRLIPSLATRVSGWPLWWSARYNGNPIIRAICISADIVLEMDESMHRAYRRPIRPKLLMPEALR
jgi:hypothetical protein